MTIIFPFVWFNNLKILIFYLTILEFYVNINVYKTKIRINKIIYSKE